MSGHPAVEFLTAALAHAEETARAANVDAPDHCPSNPVEFVIAANDLSSPVTEAAERHIRLHMPATVLRRVAADHQILAVHSPFAYAGCIVCHECSPLDPADANRRTVARLYPCRTVLLLAQAWGWTEVLGEWGQ